MGTNLGLWKLVNVIALILLRRSIWEPLKYHKSNLGIDGADVKGNTQNMKGGYKEDQVTYQAVPTWRARSALQRVGQNRR
jgi:hypothetical protein